MKNKTNTQRFFTRIFGTAAVLVMVPFFASAAITKELNYQGKLTDATNTAVADGSYNMVIRIYDAATAGSCVYSLQGSCGAPTARTVTVTDGIFSIMLGDTADGDNALTLDFNSDYYLSVDVEGDGEMLPRKKLGAVPMAFNAERLDGVVGSSFLRSDEVDTMTASSTSTLLTLDQQGSGDILNILDGGSEVMTITDGGNVGIGTTSPTQKLHVQGNARITGALYDSNNEVGTSGQVLSTTATGTDWIDISGGGASAINDLLDAQKDTANNNIFLGHAGFTGTFYNKDNIAIGIGTFDNPNTDNAYSYYGNSNTAVGYYALTNNTTGSSNSAQGAYALLSNTTGYSNSAQGLKALYSNTTGSNNSAQGLNSGQFIADGSTENTSPNQSIFLGAKTKALTANDINQIVIGYNATGLGSNTAVLGNDSITTTALKGNVGIGTTAPSKLLHLSSATNPTLRITDTTNTVNSEFRSEDSLSFLGTTSNHDLRLMTNGTSQATITAAGNVGIGTTSPGARLTVQKDESATIAEVARFENRASGGNEGVKIVLSPEYGNDDIALVGQRDGANLYSDFHIQTKPSGGNLTNQLTVKSAGNVGIGTTSPVSKVSIQSSAGSGDVVALNLNNPHSYGVGNGTAATVLRFNRAPNDAGSTGVMADISGGNQSETTSNFGYLAFGTRSGTSEATTERMRITSTGNVGIGTTAPSKLLHLSSATNPTLRITDTTNTVNSEFRSEDSLSFLGTTSNHDLRFMTNGTSQATITAAGNVGIGTTSPGARLTVQKDESATIAEVARFENRASGGNEGVKIVLSPEYSNDDIALVGQRDGVNLYSDFHIQTKPSGGNLTNRLTVKSTGNVGIGTTSLSQKFTVYNGSTTGTYTTSGWVHSSDRRLKTNITPIENALDIVNGLSGVTFNWKNTPNSDEQIGFIAQEVMDIAPQFVVGNEEDGYGVAYGNVSALLTQAIKEQQTQITGNTQDIASIAGLSNAVNDLSVNFTSFDDVEDALDDLTQSSATLSGTLDTTRTELAELTQSIAQLEDTNALILDFFEALNPDTLVYTDLDGNLTLYGILTVDKVVAEEVVAGVVAASGVVAGAFTVENDEDAPTVGTATIEAGETSVTIDTAAVTEASRIFVTFTSNLEGRSYFVSERAEGDSFTVTISDPAFEDTDVSFDWWIIEGGAPVAEAPAEEVAPAPDEEPVTDPVPTDPGDETTTETSTDA